MQFKVEDHRLPTFQADHFIGLNHSFGAETSANNSLMVLEQFFSQHNIEETNNQTNNTEDALRDSHLPDKPKQSKKVEHAPQVSIAQAIEDYQKQALFN